MGEVFADAFYGGDEGRAGGDVENFLLGGAGVGGGYGGVEEGAFLDARVWVDWVRFVVAARREIEGSVLLGRRESFLGLGLSLGLDFGADDGVILALRISDRELFHY